MRFWDEMKIGFVELEEQNSLGGKRYSRKDGHKINYRIRTLG